MKKYSISRCFPTIFTRLERTRSLRGAAQQRESGHFFLFFMKKPKSKRVNGHSNRVNGHTKRVNGHTKRVNGHIFRVKVVLIAI